MGKSEKLKIKQDTKVLRETYRQRHFTLPGSFSSSPVTGNRVPGSEKRRGGHAFVKRICGPNAFGHDDTASVRNKHHSLARSFTGTLLPCKFSGERRKAIRPRPLDSNYTVIWGGTSRKVFLSQVEEVQVILCEANREKASLREEIRELQGKLDDLDAQESRLQNDRVSHHLRFPVRCPQ